MSQEVTAIIPAYNEATTVTNPISTAISTPSISHIVIVDDGSIDDTKKTIETFLKKTDTAKRIDFISHSNNLGKSAAIASALNKVSSEATLMLDADIRDLNPTVVETMIKSYFDQQASLIIYYKYEETGTIERMVDQLLGAEMLLCGERIVETKILRELENLNSLGYALEVTINQYCIDHHKKIVLFRGPYFYHAIKQKKQNYTLLSGIIANLKMSKEIINKTSITNYIKQKQHFSRLLKNAVWYSDN